MRDLARDFIFALQTLFFYEKSAGTVHGRLWWKVGRRWIAVHDWEHVPYQPIRLIAIVSTHDGANAPSKK